MLNHFPYNHGLLGGHNRGVSLSTPPTYSPSIITAVAHVQQGLSEPKFVMGGSGGPTANTHALFKKASIYGFNLFRSKPFVIGQPFNVSSIKFTLSQAPTTDTLIVPILRFDDSERVVVGHEIDLLSYPDSTKYIELAPGTFDYNMHGEKNFVLELHFRGIDLNAIMLPIEIEIETESGGI